MALGSVFLSTLLLSFGFSLFIAGLFAAKFGQGKSRSVGFVLSLLALLIVGLFVALTWQAVPGITPIFDPDVIAQSLIAVLAATIGSIVALVAFVMSMMRS